MIKNKTNHCTNSVGEIRILIENLSLCQTIAYFNTVHRFSDSHSILPIKMKISYINNPFIQYVNTVLIHICKHSMYTQYTYVCYNMVYIHM